MYNKPSAKRSISLRPMEMYEDGTRFKAFAETVSANTWAGIALTAINAFVAIVDRQVKLNNKP